jgi:hypothetical protein
LSSQRRTFSKKIRSIGLADGLAAHALSGKATLRSVRPVVQADIIPAAAGFVTSVSLDQRNLDNPRDHPKTYVLVL